MSSLTEDKRKLSVSLDSVEADLKSAREEAEKSRGDLKKIATLFPDAAEGEDLAKNIEELKIEVATEFDIGFETALAQL